MNTRYTFEELSQSFSRSSCVSPCHQNRYFFFFFNLRNWSIYDSIIECIVKCKMFHGHNIDNGSKTDLGIKVGAIPDVARQ